MKLSVSELSEALQAKYVDALVLGVSTDSRTIAPGNLYIALKGEQFDGHDFVKEAAAKGAVAVLVDHPINGLTIPQIVVPDTLEALGYVAAVWRSSFKSHVLGVTGSNGKTTVKNMIASILVANSHGDVSRVLATKGNNNNQIGLPLNLLRLDVFHDYAVLEMGMDKPGEISYLTRIAHPNVVVITNAFPSHLKGVGDVQGVAKAKAEIFEGLVHNGIAVLNRDDHYFSYWKDLLGRRRYLSFGLCEEAEVSAIHIMSEAHQQKFLLVTPAGSIEVVMSLLGEHNIRNALAAAAACLAVEVPLEKIAEGLASVIPEGSRLQVHHLQSGATLIDDAYNANPASTRAAIDYLSILPGTKVLALGDMRELGEHELKYHAETGEYAKDKGVNVLLTYGDLMKEAAKAFGKGATHFENKEALMTAVKDYATHRETAILVKGSNSMGLQVVVKAVLNDAKTLAEG